MEAKRLLGGGGGGGALGGAGAAEGGGSMLLGGATGICSIIGFCGRISGIFAGSTTSLEVEGRSLKEVLEGRGDGSGNLV